jgi:ELWxxDGT repeat protein
MGLKKLYKRMTARAAMGRKRNPPSARRNGLRPAPERLEDRTMPSAGTGADTFLVQDINPGSDSSLAFNSNMIDMNGTLLFGAVDGSDRAGLWKSNGTAAGTALVADVGVDGPFTVIGGTAYFAGHDAGGGGLFRTDGTAAGTYSISAGMLSEAVSLTNVNGTLYFMARDPVGRGLWKSDGTAAGTVLIKKDIDAHELTDVNGTLFFESGGLWKSDGTATGTVPVTGSSGGNLMSGPTNLTSVNGTLFFSAYDAKNGRELWKSDGTAQGTTMVKNIWPGTTKADYYGTGKGIAEPNSSDPRNLTNVNGTLFFTANDGIHGEELWKSNGKSNGTVVVKDINTSPGDASWTVGGLTNVNGTLYFAAYDGMKNGLWKSDGTTAGTVLVKDISLGGNLTPAGSAAFFSANDGVNGFELWKSDGTAAGTVLVKDINPGSAGSRPTSLTLSGGHLFFAADDGVHGRELWDPVVSLDVGPNVNTSRLPFNQEETTIAVNPANPSNIFIASNSRNLHDLSTPKPAQFAAYSMDGGQTWNYVDPKDGTIADGDDDLPTARYDSSAAFDTFGNLFFAYNHFLDPSGTSGDSEVIVLLSTDGGKTFSLLDRLRPGKDTDRPVLATSPGPGGIGSSVWLSYLGGSPEQIIVQGAPVTGLGSVGALGPVERMPGLAGATQDLAVGPDGEVLISISGEAQIFTCLDPDGLGPTGFSGPRRVAHLNVRDVPLIPAQPHRGLHADAPLAYDRSGGPHHGRAYMVYIDAPSQKSDDTNIFVRFTDDNGATWSESVRVNDDSGANSQFIPHIAVDPTTGYVAVSWYDCRNDLGAGGPGDRDGIPNDDAQFWAAVSTDGGLTFAPNVQVSAGTSSANAAWTGLNEDYGDSTGLDFYGGKFYTAWADNSNSTGDNPPGAFHFFDIYTAAVTVTANESPHLTAASTATRPNREVLIATQVQPLLKEALARWRGAGADTSILGDIDVRIANLGGSTLGLASGHTIWLDSDAAGWGWFVDQTPSDDSEFLTPGNQGEKNRMDLLTVLEHEVGHLLGYEYQTTGVMIDTLSAGTRRTPSDTLTDSPIGFWFSGVGKKKDSVFGTWLVDAEN